MSQEISASAIQQPQKLRKNFCFATIPFIFIAIFTLFSSIYLPINNLRYGFSRFTLAGTLTYAFGYLLFFFGSVLLTVLLFKKTYRATLGVPLVMFPAGYILKCAAQIPFTFDIYFEHGYSTVWDSLLPRLPYILMLLAASAAFLIVSVYVFIVTARKKPAPKVLWIIPAILFCLFYSPWAIYSLIEFIRSIFNDFIYFLPFIPSYLFVPLFPVAIILLLIWISFPYKKDKSQKTAPVQPAPAVAPVPKPVQPAVEPTATEEKPAVETATQPVPQPEETPVTEEKPAETPEIQSEIEKQQAVMKLLTEYKKLLDSGVITQEDYDKKKNELLGL